MIEMIEKVARAIAKQNGGSDWDRIDEDDVFDRGYLLRRDYLSLARAAIKAMREPTHAVLKAHQIVPDDNDFDERAKANWEAMIDAACAVPADPDKYKL